MGQQERRQQGNPAHIPWPGHIAKSLQAFGPHPDLGQNASDLICRLC